MTLLTNLIFEPKGKHDPALAYTIKDTVMSADGSRVYFALKDVPAGIALSNEEYWKLQIDISGSKNAMDVALASFSDYAKAVGTRVKGETAKAIGNPVTFMPDAGSLLQPVTVLEPQQEGSGDPSPENIRPFIGYDALGLTRAGKNLIYPSVIESYSLQKFDYDIETGTFSIVKEHNEGRNQLYFRLNVNAVNLVGQKLTLSYKDFSIDQSGDSTRIYLMDQSAKSIAGIWPAEESRKSTTVVVPDGTTELRIMLRIDQRETYPAGTKMTIHGLQLEIGDVATNFTPYSGVNNYTAQIGQTYGIRYEWLTGKLTEVWRAVALRDLTMRYIGGEHDYFEINMPPDALATADFICEAYKNVDVLYYSSMPSTPTGSMGYYAQDRVWRLKDTHYKSVAELIAENGDMKIVYKLATPIETQLTPAIISAADLEQTNTLYGDGSIEVEYVKPLHVSIEERVAAALAAMAE